MGRSSTASSFATAAAAAVLLCATIASAQLDPDRSATKLLTDPIDGHQFTWTMPVAANGLGGYDSDGCAYSSGPQPRTTGIATSPTTLFSASPDRFERTIEDAQKQPLLELLSGIGAEVEDARRLRPHQQYELAAVVAEFLGDGPYVVGEHYLTAAWTIRDTIVGFLPGVQGASDAWGKLTETLPMLSQIDNDRGRTIAAFDMARLCHRGGFLIERDEFLASIDGWPDAGLGAAEKRTEFHRRIAEESRFLAKARDAFRAGLADGLGTPEDRAFYRYLVGDLSRRLGDFDEAATQLEAVALDPKASDEVKAYANDIAAVLKVQKRAPTEESPE